MNATLTDRYIQAVTRTIPERQRSDVAAELRASVADQIEARIEAGEGADAAERDVLTRLGDPEALAAGYADRPLTLIGPRYYLTWKRLLVLLLWIVPACALFGISLGQTLSGAPVGAVIGAAVSGAIGAFVHVCFWVTLVFAVLERSGASGVVAPWTLDSLPEPRATGARLSDLVASLILLALLAGAIVWDMTVGFVYLRGEWLGFLNPEVWPFVAVMLFVVLALEAALAIAVYVARRWTLPLAVVNGVLAVIAASILLSALGRGALLNPEMFDIATAAGASADLPQIVAVVVGFSVAGVAVWDIVDGFVKARRSR